MTARTHLTRHRPAMPPHVADLAVRHWIDPTLRARDLTELTIRVGGAALTLHLDERGRRQLAAALLDDAGQVSTPPCRVELDVPPLPRARLGRRKDYAVISLDALGCRRVEAER